MSEAAPRQGLAARLLRSAEGRVTALRPQIPASSWANAAKDTPLLERTGETQASAPAAPRRSADQPAPETAPRKALAEPEPLRLMLSEPPPLAANLDSDAEPRASNRPVRANPAMAKDSLVPAPAQRAEERRADSLSSALMQLLGPDAAETAGAPEAQPQRRAPVAAGPPVSTASAPAETASACLDAGPRAAPDPAPLQIHIGELIIAPDPRPPLHQAAPAAWEPPLSLADYRASRGREQG